MTYLLDTQRRKERSGDGVPTLCQVANLHYFICPSQQFDENGSIVPIVQMKKLDQKGSVMCPQASKWQS